MKKYIFEILLILAGLGIAASLLAGLDERATVQSLEVEIAGMERAPQVVSQSRVVSITAEPIYELFEPGEPLWGPIDVRLDQNGRPMVIDFGDSTIKLLGDQGELLTALGKGKGQGPGEFQAITDVAAFDHEIWVTDAGNSRLASFDRLGKIQETIKLETRPYRLATMEEERFLMMHTPSQLETFGVYSRDGKLNKAFGKFIDKPWDGQALDGMLSRAPTGEFFYIGKYLGFFSLYDQQGVLRYSRETLSPTPLPELTKKGGVVRVARRSAVNALSASVSGDQLFLLRGTVIGNWLSDEIEVYDLSSGDYVHSFQLPEPAERVYFHGNSFYQVKGSTLSKWRYEIQ
ncbi:MAG: hypothetical protein AAGM22_24355 [Acidobacteriota bacterium]